MALCGGRSGDVTENACRAHLVVIVEGQLANDDFLRLAGLGDIIGADAGGGAVAEAHIPRRLVGVLDHIFERDRAGLAPVARRPVIGIGRQVAVAQRLDHKHICADVRLFLAAGIHRLPVGAALAEDDDQPPGGVQRQRDQIVVVARTRRGKPVENRIAVGVARAGDDDAGAGACIGVALERRGHIAAVIGVRVRADLAGAARRRRAVIRAIGLIAGLGAGVDPCKGLCRDRVLIIQNGTVSLGLPSLEQIDVDGVEQGVVIGINAVNADCVLGLARLCRTSSSNRMWQNPAKARLAKGGTDRRRHRIIRLKQGINQFIVLRVGRIIFEDELVGAFALDELASIAGVEPEGNRHRILCLTKGAVGKDGQVLVVTARAGHRHLVE